MHVQHGPFSPPEFNGISLSHHDLHTLTHCDVAVVERKKQIGTKRVHQEAEPWDGVDYKVLQKSSQATDIRKLDYLCPRYKLPTAIWCKLRDNWHNYPHAANAHLDDFLIGRSGILCLKSEPEEVECCWSAKDLEPVFPAAKHIGESRSHHFSSCYDREDIRSYTPIHEFTDVDACPANESGCIANYLWNLSEKTLRHHKYRIDCACFERALSACYALRRANRILPRGHTALTPVLWHSSGGESLDEFPYIFDLDMDHTNIDSFRTGTRIVANAIEDEWFGSGEPYIAWEDRAYCTEKPVIANRCSASEFLENKEAYKDDFHYLHINYGEYLPAVMGKTEYRPAEVLRPADANADCATVEA